MKSYDRLSPPGLAAVAIWRLHDRRARWPGRLQRPSGEALAWPTERRVRHALLVGEAGPIDEILAVGGPGWLELHSHGGLGVQLALEEFLTGQGWVPEPFAEQPAVPLSLRAARALASARWGALAKLDGEARQVLAGRGPQESVMRHDLVRSLEGSLALADHGRRLLSPALVRLVGRPNAGKSTLFNALLSDRRALVSPHPGTTRDSVRAGLSVHGVPIVLEDTAGRNQPSVPMSCAGDPAPDLVIQLLRTPDEAQLVGPCVLVVLGLADRQRSAELTAVSGRTGEGLEALLAAIGAALGLKTDESFDAFSPLEAELLCRLERARDQLIAG